MNRSSLRAPPPSRRPGRLRHRILTGECLVSVFALVVGLVVATMVTTAPSASAAPGNPGVPGAPRVLFTEDFDNAPNNSNVLLTNYVGESGTTYTGDPFWVSRNNCNGFIIDHGSPRVAGDCSGAQTDTFGEQAYDSLTAIPRAIGLFNGLDSGAANLNGAASSYTSGSTTDNEVQFETQSPIQLPAANRFVTFSVDAGAENCFATHPELRFYLKNDAGAEFPVSDTAIDRTVDLGRLVVQARRSEDWAMLRDLWAARGLELVARHQEAASRAYGRLRADVTARMPALAIAGAVVGLGLVAADGDAVMHRYVRAGQSMGPRALEVAHPEDMAAVVAAILVARRHDGDLEGALDAARWYDGRVARGDVRGRASPSVRAWLELHRGRTQLLAGDLSGAIISSESAYGLGAGRADCQVQCLSAAGQAALASTLLGSPRDARRWSEVAGRCPVAPGWLGEWARLPARIAQAMLALDALDRAGVEEHLEALRCVPVTEELWPWAALVLTRYASLFGDPAAKVLWLYDALARRGTRHAAPMEEGVLLQRCALHLHIAAGELTRAMAELESSPYPRNRFATADARLQLLAGRESRSRAIAEAAARAPETPARDRGGLLLVQAAAALRCGRVEESGRALQAAHAVIERTGTTSAYATVPSADLAALLALQGDPPRVSQDAHHRLSSRQVAGGPLVVLTPRELEVLRQSARHGSVAAVARVLSVSVNTVKKQRVSLYAKLGVRDHESAVLRGRQLGLVDS